MCRSVISNAHSAFEAIRYICCVCVWFAPRGLCFNAISSALYYRFASVRRMAIFFCVTISQQRCNSLTLMHIWESSFSIELIFGPFPSFFVWYAFYSLFFFFHQLRITFVRNESFWHTFDSGCWQHERNGEQVEKNAIGTNEKKWWIAIWEWVKFFSYHRFNISFVAHQLQQIRQVQRRLSMATTREPNTFNSAAATDTQKRR